MVVGVRVAVRVAMVAMVVLVRAHLDVGTELVTLHIDEFVELLRTDSAHREVNVRH